MNLKEVIISNKLTLIVGVIGAIGGLLYWHFIGCQSGSCAITSSPSNSTLYGAFMGGLLGNIFQSEHNKKQIKNN
jgi:outer membrane lipoprotein SlyB